MNAMTVEVGTDVTMVVSAPLRHLCPFVDEVDDGSVTIAWETRGATYELHSLAQYLGTFAGTAISHEQLTERICQELSAAAGIRVLSVESKWITAEQEVTCSTSPIRAAMPA